MSPVYDPGGSGDGSSTIVVPTIAAAQARATKAGLTFFVESENDFYGSQSCVVTAGVVGSITSVAIVDSDFHDRVFNVPANDLIDYIGPRSTDPSDPVAGTSKVFWDITDGNTLGSGGGLDQSRLKTRANGAVHGRLRVTASLLWRNEDEVTFIGSTFNSTIQLGIGSADIDTEAEVQSYLDANDDIAAKVADSTKLVLYATATNLYKVTAFVKSTPEVTGICLATLGSGGGVIVSSPSTGGNAKKTILAAFDADAIADATATRVLADPPAGEEWVHLDISAFLHFNTAQGWSHGIYIKDGAEVVSQVRSHGSLGNRWTWSSFQNILDPNMPQDTYSVGIILNTATFDNGFSIEYNPTTKTISLLMYGVIPDATTVSVSQLVIWGVSAPTP